MKKENIKKAITAIILSIAFALLIAEPNGDGTKDILISLCTTKVVGIVLVIFVIIFTNNNNNTSVQ